MEEDTVKIEKIVLLETFGETQFSNKYAAAILECEVGDSFLIPDEDDKNRNTVCRTAARRGMRVASRLASPCPKTGKPQRRVWRIE